MFVLLDRNCCSLKNLVIVICTLLTCFLTFTVVFKFVITKPTSSSQEHPEFNFETLPDVLICVEPAINLTISQRYGYNTPWSYWLGRNSSWESLGTLGNFIGWNGEEEGQNNSSEILEDILNVNDKLVGRASYLQRNGAYVYDSKTPDEFRILMYPFGRCQLVRLATKFPNVIAISLLMNTSNILKITNEIKDSRLNILLMDPVNSPLIFPIVFQMRGASPIKLDLKNTQWRSYLVKVSQSRNVERNPQFDCRDYSLTSTFGKCIKEEFERRFTEILKCTPPWIPTEHVCNKRFNLEEGEANKLNELFFHEQYKSKFCKPPCTQTTYDAVSANV